MNNMDKLTMELYNVDARNFIEEMQQMLKDIENITEGKTEQELDKEDKRKYLCRAHVNLAFAIEYLEKGTDNVDKAIKEDEQ